MTEKEKYMGVVKRELGKLRFYVLDPPSEEKKELFITTIDRQTAVDPYSSPMILDKYEDLVIIIHGFTSSGILYSPEVIEVAGSILSKVVEKIYSRA